MRSTIDSVQFLRGIGVPMRGAERLLAALGLAGLPYPAGWGGPSDAYVERTPISGFTGVIAALPNRKGA
ncbi:MAG: hypothetical protein ABSE35_15435 [Bryobacteraceae bacterium]|jgi:hypothetical protein